MLATHKKTVSKNNRQSTWDGGCALGSTLYRGVRGECTYRTPQTAAPPCTRAIHQETPGSPQSTFSSSCKRHRAQAGSHSGCEMQKDASTMKVGAFPHLQDAAEANPRKSHVEESCLHERDTDRATTLHSAWYHPRIVCP